MQRLAPGTLHMNRVRDKLVELRAGKSRIEGALLVRNSFTRMGITGVFPHTCSEQDEQS